VLEVFMTKQDVAEPGTALVTGASSGIGLELARELAANGHSLILVARDRVKLTATGEELHARYGVSAHVHAQDLSEPGAAEDLWFALAGAGRTVDILVNNAGVGAYGKFEDQPIDVVTRMLMINAVALTTLTRLALPDMLARKRGRILNVASVVGYQPGGPRMAVYYATKSYVLSFSKGLARELAGSGVSVTALSPGVTKSSFEDRAGASETRLYSLVPQATAQVVARAGYRAMMRGRRVAIPGLMTKVLSIAGELPPRVVALEVNRWLLSRRTSQRSPR
jgi:short-subunit dehydrogenase